MLEFYEAVLFALLMIVVIVWAALNISYVQYLQSRKTDSVVRCKDCAVPHNRWTGCPKMNGTIMPPDGFCSFGERRDDKWDG